MPGMLNGDVMLRGAKVGLQCTLHLQSCTSHYLPTYLPTKVGMQCTVSGTLPGRRVYNVLGR